MRRAICGVASSILVIGCSAGDGGGAAANDRNVSIASERLDESLTAISGLQSSSLSASPASWLLTWPRIPVSAGLAKYTVFRDGYPFLDVDPNHTWCGVGNEDRECAGIHGLVPNAQYTYQVAWTNSAGARSPLSNAVSLIGPVPGTLAPFADGNFRLGAVLVRFQDRPNAPYTASQANSTLFVGPGSLSAYVQEVSRGAATVTGDVFGWLTLPQNRDTTCPGFPPDYTVGYNCSISSWSLIDFARSQGVPVDSYEGLVFLVDGVVAAGFGSTPPAKPQAMLGAGPNIALEIVFHEVLGHGLGLDHAGNLECPSGRVNPDPNDIRSGGCVPSRYGDPYDPMGAPHGLHHLHTQNLEQLGWVQPSEIQVGVVGQSYWLGKLSSTSLTTKQLRLPLDGNGFYFFDYRALEGFEYQPSDSRKPGVQAHLWQNTVVSGPNLGDTASLDLTGYQPLRPAQTFTDPYRDIGIRVQEETVEGARVAVFKRSQVCADPAQSGPGGEYHCYCSPCVMHEQCVIADDCASGVCEGGKCTVSPTRIDTGNSFACALYGDAKLRCWGQNDQGQLGVTTSGSVGDQPGELGVNWQALPTAGSVTRMSLGNAHGCAVLAGGSLQCWGANESGQLGVGDTTPRSTPVTVDVGGSVVDVSAGDDFTCVRLSGGAVKCWGQNYFGQLGVGHARNLGDNPGEMGSALVSVNLGAPALQIAAGGAHVCALLNNGMVRCWGYAIDGQLGGSYGVAYGDASNETTPPTVSLGSDFTDIAQITAGEEHSCALSGVSMKCWGANDFGQLGYGDRRSRGKLASDMGDNLPVVPVPLVSRINARVHETCAVDLFGGLRCWGFGGTAVGQPYLSEQFNVGDEPGELAAMPVIDFGANQLVRSGADSFTTSGFSGCVILTDNSIKCWGWNGSGELGLGDTVPRGTSTSQMGDNLPRLPSP